MNRVGPLHRAMAPSHFTFGSHSAIFKGFCQVCALQGPCLTRSWPSCFAWLTLVGLAKEREEFQLQGPSIIEGFRRNGYLTLGSGAVGWFNPATETGRCLTAEFDRFFYPVVLGSWQISLLGLRNSAWKFLQSDCCCF